MIKTDEFRIKESAGVFSVQRKFMQDFFVKLENWHTYVRSQLGTFFLVVDISEESKFSKSLATFPTLESAKEFIKNELADELKAEEKPIEDVVYHSYP